MKKLQIDKNYKFHSWEVNSEIFLVWRHPHVLCKCCLCGKEKKFRVGLILNNKINHCSCTRKYLNQLDEDNRKICCSCKNKKSGVDFGISSKTLDGLRKTCKLCERERHLKRTFNIKNCEYDKLLKLGKNKCWCCGKTETVAKNNGDTINLAVDHCHNTNIIRGLLCTNCNTGIARLGDNLQGLNNAVKYLKKFENKIKRETKNER